MHRHQGYYEELSNNYNTEMLSYKKIIVVDLKRTGTKETTESARETMLKILYNFAKRNMEIGYCQGMNFLCYFLLQMGFQEEQIFWVICFVFERLMPNNYYVNMIPIIADIDLLKMLLEEFLPHLMVHLAALGVDLNFVLLPLFVTAFTSIKNFKAS